MSRSRWQEPRVKVRKNKSGAVWWAEWWVYEPQPNGSEKREHRSVVLGACDEIGKTQAKQILAEQVRKPAPISRTWTVGRWVKEVWLPRRMERWSHNSKDALMPLVNNHILPAFGHMALTDVRPFHIDAHLAALAAHGAAKNTMKSIRWLERNLFQHMERNGMIERSPACYSELPVMAAPKRTQPYTLEEARLLASVPGLEGLALRTLLLCGLRPGELLSLRRRDLIGGVLVVSESTDHAGHYKATKTHRTRPVPVPPELRRDLEALAAGMPEDGLLLGLTATTKGLRERLLAAVGGAVPGFTVRRCRTTTATLIDSPIEDKRDILGHTDIEMTVSHYAMALPARQAAAVAEFEKRVSGTKESEKVQ